MRKSKKKVGGRLTCSYEDRLAGAEGRGQFTGGGSRYPQAYLHVLTPLKACKHTCMHARTHTHTDLCICRHAQDIHRHTQLGGKTNGSIAYGTARLPCGGQSRQSPGRQVRALPAAVLLLRPPVPSPRPTPAALPAPSGGSVAVARGQGARVNGSAWTGGGKINTSETTQKN